MDGKYPAAREVQTGADPEEAVVMSDQEVPEPDAVEQALPVTDSPAFVDPSSDAEAPEADALEQAITAPVDEEEGRA